MDDAKNFVLGIFQTLRERFGNPLVSAFAVAWAVWNFRLLLVLIGSGEGGWQAKIEYIDTRLMLSPKDWLFHGLLIPLGVALAWIYALPPLLRAVATHHEKNTNRAREAIFAVTEARTLSAEEALHLRSVMVKQRAEWQTEKAETVQSLENFEKRTADQAKALAAANERAKALQDELARLKAPPQKEPFDFNGKPTAEKAGALGLRLDPTGAPGKVLVTFDGQAVKWPWAPGDAAKLNFPTTRIAEHPLREETLAAALLIKSEGLIGKKMPEKDWANLLQTYGFRNPGQEVRQLFYSGFLSGAAAEPACATNEAKVFEWLSRVGFSANIEISKQ